MSTKILYGVIFITFFILTTVGIIFMNAKYTNIFHLDFSPLITQQDSLALKIQLDSLNKAKEDSLKRLNPEKKHEITMADTSFSEKNKKEIKQEKTTEHSNSNESQPIDKSIVTAMTLAKDTSYQSWKKETIKILEQLDPKKSAKLIKDYSDNIGRDIIYSMNKKKAAKIISELDNETAKRLMSTK